MPNLWISAGHSGPGESGTQGKDGVNEREVTIAIVNECKKRGMRTVPFFALGARIEYANRYIMPEDYLIELHCDAEDKDPGSDCGVFYFDGSEWAKKQGDVTGRYWKDLFGHDRYWVRPDTSARQGRLGIIRDTRCPAWLLEMIDISDIEKRDKIVKEGAVALQELENILFPKEPVKTEPSEWASVAWEKAQKKGVFNGQDPQGIVTNEMLEIVLQRLGAFEKIENILTRERFAVALDRLKLLE